jgi:hypothetical protein
MQAITLKDAKRNLPRPVEPVQAMQSRVSS